MRLRTAAVSVNEKSIRLFCDECFLLYDRITEFVFTFSAAIAQSA